MSPVTHLFASWIIAAKTTDNPRDCRIVTLAGILPDADGLVLLADWVNQWLGREELYLYQRYHHFLLHGVWTALAFAALAALLARRRWRVAGLTLVVFHLHLLCDLVGSRGPSISDLWPIYYLGPFSKQPMWVWWGQWPLDAWPNRVISVMLVLWSLWQPVHKGHSVVGVFNRRADAVVVGVLQKWWRRWGKPARSSNHTSEA
jgi:hypothetical protein